jgi:hypothetical protein
MEEGNGIGVRRWTAGTGRFELVHVVIFLFFQVVLFLKPARFTFLIVLIILVEVHGITVPLQCSPSPPTPLPPHFL